MFFSCGVIANFVFFVSNMLIPQGVMRCQHSLTPEQFDAGIHPGILASLYGVLSSPFVCSRCGCVKGICEAISSLLARTMKRGEKSKGKVLPG